MNIEIFLYNIVSTAMIHWMSHNVSSTEDRFCTTRLGRENTWREILTTHSPSDSSGLIVYRPRAMSISQIGPAPLREALTELGVAGFEGGEGNGGPGVGSSGQVLDFLIDPGMYRDVEETVRTVTG